MHAASLRRTEAGAWVVGLVLLASLATLAAAFAAEHLFGLEPCILCLYERVPFAIAAVVAAVALLIPAGNIWRIRLVAVVAAVFVVGAGLAVYHVGVEQHWWRSVAACGGALPTDVEDLRNLSATDLKPCDRVDWRLFGLSLAGYNVILSFALAAASFVGMRMLTRKA
ncbi:MAG: disulfide bond formation protein B [Rhodospirillales bacterium]|nr:disulfide bond formation protein B [Rhodospirillales bacterium]